MSEISSDFFWREEFVDLVFQLYHTDEGINGLRQQAEIMQTDARERGALLLRYREYLRVLEVASGDSAIMVSDPGDPEKRFIWLSALVEHLSDPKVKRPFMEILVQLERLLDQTRVLRIGLSVSASSSFTALG